MLVEKQYDVIIFIVAIVQSVFSKHLNWPRINYVTQKVLTQNTSALDYYAMNM